MYSLIADKTILPAIDLVMGTRFHKYLHFYRKSQWWAKERLYDFQNVMLKRLVKHCYDNVPFYYKTFKKLRLTPVDIKDTMDLEKLPIIDKKTILNNFSDFFSNKISRRKLIKRRTSGSTAEPFTYYLDKNSWSASWALLFRCWEESGWRFGDKIITFLGGSLITKEKKSLFNNIRYKIENNYVLPSLHLDSNSLAFLVNDLNHIRPKYLRGLPVLLDKLSEFILTNDIQVPPIKGIFTLAEKLYDAQREKITDAFNCSVYEGYGGSEGGVFCMECSFHSGFHFCLDSGIFEIITNERKAEEGELGELVYTNIYNYGMPLIRYKSGDMATNELAWNCQCGRKSPVLKSRIEGRKNEVLEFSNGRILSPTIFHRLFVKYDIDIRSFQIVQTSKDSIELRIVRGINFNDGLLKDVIETVQFHCGGEVNVSYRFMSEIPKSKSGKLQFVFSQTNNLEEFKQ